VAPLPSGDAPNPPLSPLLCVPPLSDTPPPPPCCSNAPAAVNHGAQFSFALGTGDWSFAGSSPCPGGVSTCYNVESVSVSVDSGASVSSSFSWSGSALTVSPTVSGRLGPLSVTYTVVVRQHQEQTLSRQVNYQVNYDCCDCYDENGCCGSSRRPECGCCDTLCCQTEYYQARVDLGTTSFTASATLLLLPTGVTVQTQPSSAYTAATTTNVAVTLQLQPAVTLTSGHPFTAEMTSVSESGTSSRQCARDAPAFACRAL